MKENNQPLNPIRPGEGGWEGGGAETAGADFEGE